MAQHTGGSFRGNEAEAAAYLRQSTGQEPSSGMIRYLAYGGDISGSDASRLGVGGGATTGAGQTAATDFSSIVQQALQMQQQATQPAIEAARASIPITQSAFAQQKQTLEGEREPLKQRYQSILDELTRKEKVETQTAQTRLAREYGKRGVPLSSGAYEQNLAEVTQPISQFYGGQAKDVGLERETALRGLTGQLGALPIQEQQSLNQINQAIAALQSGAGKEAISNALNLLQMQRQEGYQSATLALQQRQLEESIKRAAEEQAFQQRQYQEVTLPKTKYELGKPYYKTESGVSGVDFGALWEQFNQ